MRALLVCGAGAGLGAFVVWRALAPRPVPLDALAARLARPASPGRRPASLGPLAVRLAGRRLGEAERAAQLALAGRSPERHALAKAAGAAAGAGVVVAFAAVLGVAGLAPPAGVVALGAAAIGAGGYVLPDAVVAEAAARRRRAIRHALSGYLDLVNIILAAGGGLETALHGAAEAGGGSAFADLRRCLDRARLTGRTPWEGFADLGARLGVPELEELAASVALAGAQGARIRRSLAAKADALRAHQVTECETSAEAATERMTIPIAVLLFGFLTFIAYPAVQAITTVSNHVPR